MRVGLVAVALLLLAALANRPAMGHALAGPVQREAAAAQLQAVAPAVAEKGTAKPVMTRPNDASKMKRTSEAQCKAGEWNKHGADVVGMNVSF